MNKKMPYKYLRDLLKNLTDHPFPDCEIYGISADSRQVSEGNLFFAYPGQTVDGRHYIQAAIKSGAKVIVYACDDGWQPDCAVSKAALMIPVRKLDEKLGVIASRFYDHPSAALTVIGVTGTNGKTSCCHYIANVLSNFGTQCGVIGTIGNGFVHNLSDSSLTTPDAICLQKTLADMVHQGAKVVAMEVSSHALVQHRIVGVQFDIAVLTQVSQDHLDYHHSIDAYRKAKELLFCQPGLTHAVINIDDSFGKYLAKKYVSKLNIYTYSTLGRQFDACEFINAEKIIADDNGFEVRVVSKVKAGHFYTSLLGQFSVSNLLAVFSVMRVLKVSFTSTCAALEKLMPLFGRMQQFGGGLSPTVIVDYAHTPDALEKALCALREHCQGDLICVFGCGGNRDRGKRPLMAKIAEKLADKVIFTNDNPRLESPQQIIDDMIAGLLEPDKVMVEFDRGYAIAKAIGTACQADIILVAGKGHETTQVIGCRVTRFVDSEVVQSLLSKQL